MRQRDERWLGQPASETPQNRWPLETRLLCTLHRSEHVNFPDRGEKPI